MSSFNVSSKENIFSLILNLDVFMYLILLVAVFFIYNLEEKDWLCDDISQPKKQCDGNDGMPFRGSQPFPNDTIPVLLDKIGRASKAERKSIKWRRSFLVSFIIILLLFVLIITPASLPKWYVFYLSGMVCFIIIYYQFNWYDYHRFKIPEEYIGKSIDLINKKM